ncbi:MAG: hypothetical protein A2140_03100 [Candidatus Muproteobacteria bacterium RBG_16_62_13]|uniref:Uncharacterized protein n=1 Tax=Candidatus Muproteobacteria bacterium RBG_16_62_13 TaxID=1817756 RepID=A0A1F6SXB4_9PROT|nr:MAG: hypothetical protein A2140_03100 [Candidatus Muproteobacteria bacterium RBG_16_62_13]
MDPISSLRLATVSVEFNLTALYFVALVVAGMIGLIVRHKLRQWRTDRVCRLISEAVMRYFEPMGIEVDVETYSRFEGRRFVVAINSEPIKKFRYSFIVEQSLVREVRKATGRQIEKVYWRFPLGRSAGDAPADEPEDRYLVEGQARAMGEVGYGVEESSWEQYQQAVKSSESGKPSG